MYTKSEAACLKFAFYILYVKLTYSSELFKRLYLMILKTIKDSYYIKILIVLMLVFKPLLLLHFLSENP